MSATSTFFNGRIISIPGSYSEVDPSGLEVRGLGATGIVALLGSSIGGTPVTAIAKGRDLPRLPTAGRARKYFQGGDLLNASLFCLDPSTDDAITSGAQEIVVCKTDPSTQSTATLSNAFGDTIDITSRDYGDHVNQINVEVGDGTTLGKRLTVTFEDVTETFDNVGGTAMYSLQYREETGIGWDTMTMDVLTTGVRANATRVEAGLDGDVTTGLSGVVTVVSTDVGDTGTCTVYGLVGGAPAREVIVLTGTTPAAGTTVFDAGEVHALELDEIQVGNVTVRDSVVTTLLTITAGQVASGGVKASTMFVALDTMTLVADGATTQEVTFWGTNAANATTAERIALTGTTSLPTVVTDWAQIEFIVLGELEVARTLTITATAAQTLNTLQDTMVKLRDYFNARQVTNAGMPTSPWGFELTLISGLTSLSPANLDVTTAAVNIDSPATGSFYADTFFEVDALNSGSTLVSAAAASGVTGGASSNTSQPVYLSGAVQGTSTSTEFIQALELLKEIRVNTVVAVTADPAIHALVEAHCQYMAGIGRSERDSFAGALNGAMTALPSKAEFQSQALALNSRHMRLVGQGLTRFNATDELEDFDPPFFAAELAGMQAGSNVGTSLTEKFFKASDLKQAADWSPVNDAEELIQSGCLIGIEEDGRGFKVVRNVTTYLQSTNIAYTEGSTNEAVNFAVFTLRTDMQSAVGENGFAGTLNAAYGVARQSLLGSIKLGAITAFEGLTIEINLDTLDLDVGISPVIPINFVRSTIHLVTSAQRLAA